MSRNEPSRNGVAVEPLVVAVHHACEESLEHFVGEYEGHTGHSRSAVLAFQQIRLQGLKPTKLQGLHSRDRLVEGGGNVG